MEVLYSPGKAGEIMIVRHGMMEIYIRSHGGLLPGGDGALLSRQITPYNAWAAWIMKAATLSGWDTIGTWLDPSSRVVAFILFASALSKSGLII